MKADFQHGFDPGSELACLACEDKVDIQRLVKAYKALYPEELLERYKHGERDFRGINLLRAELEHIFVVRLKAGQSIDTYSVSESVNPLWDDYRWGIEPEFEWDSFGHFIPVEFDDLLPTRDLSGADLRGIDLSESYLYPVNFRGTNLSGANLKGVKVFDSDFSGVDFNHADLRRAKFSETDLSRANLYMARLEKSVFSSCNLQGGNLKRAKLRKAALVGSNLKQVNLEKAHFHRTWLSGSSLVGVRLRDADLSYCIIDGTKISKRQRNAFLKALHVRYED